MAKHLPSLSGALLIVAASVAASIATTNFPSGRVKIFAHGQTEPVAPNSNPDGRAQNRRVEIVMGTAK